MGQPRVLSDEQRRTIESWRAAGQRIVFTNGVFDLLHRGHVEYLAEARALGERLVVGVNSDASVRRLGKGAERPLVPEADRAAVVAALACVDLVVVFDDSTPEALIREVRPAVLAKGGRLGARADGRRRVRGIAGWPSGQHPPARGAQHHWADRADPSGARPARAPAITGRPLPVGPIA